MSQNSRNRLELTVTALMLTAPTASLSQDLITRDRVGPEDAPNVVTFRLTAYDLYSSDPATSAKFEELFTDFILTNPGWRIETQLATDNIGQEQARMLEQVRAGRGPDCAMIDSSALGLFKSAGVLQPMNAHFTQDQIDDMFPFVRDAVSDAAGNVLAWWWFTSLQLLSRDTSLVPEAPQTWVEVQETALATVAAGREAILFNGGCWGAQPPVLSLNIFNSVFYGYNLGGGSALAVIPLALE